ncbi:MAG: FHA domain-containing protein [Chitinivibrionales bacterium]|nr:FHA domain-containing protein [Chitinivibrionales bacterium]
MAILILQRDNKKVGAYVMDKTIVTIGRGHDNTISIANESVSRHHCRIEKTDEGYAITDLGSLNGTYVNDKQIKRSPLTFGDKIQISTYSLVFKKDEENEQEGTAEEKSPENDSPALREREASGSSKSVADPLEHVKSFSGSPEEAPFHHGGDNDFSIKSELLSSELLLVNISIQGSVDQENTKELKRVFEGLFRDGTFNVLIDLSRVTSIGSTGWGILVNQLKKAKDDRRIIVLADMSPKIEEQFELLALDNLFDCYPSVNEALTDLHQKLFAAAPREKPTLMAPPKTETIGEAAFVSPLAEEPHSIEEEAQKESTEEPDREPTDDLQSQSVSPQQSVETAPKEEIDKQNLPVHDKIKMIILENPFFEDKEIRLRLASPEYGKVKIGRLKFRSMLKTMNLETREKRYQYFKMM